MNCELQFAVWEANIEQRAIGSDHNHVAAMNQVMEKQNVFYNIK